jgi:hypothetical protein
MSFLGSSYVIELKKYDRFFSHKKVWLSTLLWFILFN